MAASGGLCPHNFERGGAKETQIQHSDACL